MFGRRASDIAIIESGSNFGELAELANMLERDALQCLSGYGISQDDVSITSVIEKYAHVPDTIKKAMNILISLRYLDHQAHRFSLRDEEEFEAFCHIAVTALLAGREGVVISKEFAYFIKNERHSSSSKGGRANVDNNYEPRRKRARAIFDDLWWNHEIRHKTAKAWVDAIKRAAPEDQELQRWSLRTLSGEIADWEKENSSRGSKPAL